MAGKKTGFKRPSIFGTVMTGDGSSVLGSVHTIKRAGDDQFLDYEEEVRAKNWNYEGELRKRKMEEEKRRQRKDDFNKRVNSRNWFEKEERKRKEKEKATALWKRANVKKVRDDMKWAIIREAMNEGDPRRELERQNREKEERLQKEARIAEVKYLKW